MIHRFLHSLMGMGFLIAAGIGLAGCNGLSTSSSQGGASGDSAADGEFPDGVEAGDGLEPGQRLPTSGVINARIRNLTDQYADVTLRFLLRDLVVRLTFIRVPARTSTTIVGPELADLFEASGLMQDGSEIPPATFRFGIDFDAGTEAVYVIGQTQPGENIAPTLVFLDAIGDRQFLPGESFQVAINDEDPDSAAALEFLLDSDEQPLSGNEISLASGLSEDADGQADTIELTIPTATPGRYFLFGVIRDELSTDVVQAEGTITIREQTDAEPPDPPNVAPVLVITQPANNVEVILGQVLDIAWTVADPDSSAVISLHLDPDDARFDGDEILLRSAIAESDDRPADSAAVVLDAETVPPGTYRVVGMVADETSSAVAVSPGIVSVVRPTENLAPTLSIIEPSANVTVELGSTLFVFWEDDDPEDNAEINFFLDADKIDLDGGEIFIKQSFEDLDGPGFDDAQIAIVDVEPGVYDLLGVTFDGESFATARAVGRVTVLDPTPPPPGGGGGNGGTGGGGPPNCGTSDFNLDGQINLRDFAAFQNCYVAQDQLCRCAFDVDLNNEIDPSDYVELFLRFIGEGDS